MTSTCCRVLNHLSEAPAGDGPWNMAVDEVLLECAVASGACALRFYGWSEPTLSLGYFQRSAERGEHGPSRSCAMVRRMSGGGAIVHDRELTYCLALPASHYLAADHQRLGLVVHQALIAALADWQIQAVLVSGDSMGRTTRPPFMCFLRRAPGDVLIGNTKIAGSAQRRSRGAVFQHGSVLLARSRAAPQLGGIEETSGRSISSRELAAAWLARLEQSLSVSGHADALTGEERSRARQLVRRRYGSPQWTHRR